MTKTELLLGSGVTLALVATIALAAYIVAMNRSAETEIAALQQAIADESQRIDSVSQGSDEIRTIIRDEHNAGEQPLPRTSSESFDFMAGGQALAKWSSEMPVELHDQVVVDVVIQSEAEQYRRCAQPIMFGPLGNPLAPLMPRQAGDTGATYRFAFVAAIDGTASVWLDNQKCALGVLPAQATVTWKVTPLR